MDKKLYPIQIQNQRGVQLGCLTYTKLKLDKDVDIIKLIGWLKMTPLENFPINWILVEFV